MDKTAKTKGDPKAENSTTKTQSSKVKGVFYEQPQDPWDMIQSPIFADFDIKNKLVRGSMLHIDFLSFGKLTKMIADVPEGKMLFVRRKDFLMPQGFFVVNYQDQKCIEHIADCAKQMGNTKRIYIFDDAADSFVKQLRDALSPTIQLGILSINISSNSGSTARARSTSEENSSSGEQA